MTDFNFISANETRKALFYQLPKVLFESDKYMKMSNDSKIAYAMLKDHCEYSLQNDWVDQNGNIYFIFTTAELMDLLHVGNNKVATIKKELASYGLLLSMSMATKKCCFWAIENVGIWSSVLLFFFCFVFAIAFHSIGRSCNLNNFRVMDQSVQ